MYYFMWLLKIFATLNLIIEDSNVNFSLIDFGLIMGATIVALKPLMIFLNSIRTPMFHLFSCFQQSIVLHIAYLTTNQFPIICYKTVGYQGNCRLTLIKGALLGEIRSPWGIKMKYWTNERRDELRLSFCLGHGTPN